MSRTTTKILCDLARVTPSSQLDSEARAIADRHGADPDACVRYATLMAKDDTTERLPTAEELEQLKVLCFQIDTRVVAGETYRRAVRPRGWAQRLEDGEWRDVPPGSTTLPKSIAMWVDRSM